jgi:hypothetical protein
MGDGRIPHPADVRKSPVPPIPGTTDLLFAIPAAPRLGASIGKRRRNMDKLKRLALPMASLIALAIAAGASWRL